MADFRIVKGTAIAYGDDGSRLAYTGDEAKLSLTEDQVTKLRRAKVIEDVPVEESAARETATTERESAPAAAKTTGGKK